MTTKNKKIRELTEINDDLENYFRNTIIPQLFIDANYILRKFTPLAMSQFDIRPEDIGKSMNEIQDHFRFPTLVTHIRQVITTNEILEMEIETNDFRWYQMNVLPYIRHRNGELDGVIVTFVEITSRIQQEKEQAKLISDHETLLDTLSHDVKNPLNILVLILEELKNVDQADRENYLKLVNMMERATAKMHKLILELTDTREHEHRYGAHAEVINIPQIVEEICITLEDDIRNKKAKIHTDFQSTEITFSKRMFRTIIYNLMSNSLKYKSSDRDPEIYISTKNNDEQIIITVKDNGIGIEEANHDLIFQKYKRVGTEIEGSGIGLHLVKEIVTNSGGDIQVSSEIGKGTEIKILLASMDED